MYVVGCGGGGGCSEFGHADSTAHACLEKKKYTCIINNYNQMEIFYFISRKVPLKIGFNLGVSLIIIIIECSIHNHLLISARVNCIRLG